MQYLRCPKQQLRVLKKREGTLPQELLRSVAPPPLESQLQQAFLPATAINQDKSAGKNVEDHGRQLEYNEKDSQAVPSTNGHNFSKDEAFAGDDKATPSTVHMPGAPTVGE